MGDSISVRRREKKGVANLSVDGRPLGRGWARFVPDKEFSFPLLWIGKERAKGSMFKKITLKLNPGPFNVKEHAIIVVMASVSFSVAYATDIILAQKVFYNQDFGLTWQLLLVISTQSLGYGIAGMMRRFLGEFLSLSLSTEIYADYLQCIPPR
jgi:hypothetical protein